MGLRFAAAIGAVFILVLVGASARADYATGAKAFRAKDYAAALAAWQPLADEGHLRAQFGLGIIFEEGGVGIEPDLDKAVAWYREAAEQGLADAQFNLGILYRTGRGVEKDPRRAVVWFLKAAIQSMPTAQYNLALSYDTGIGAAQNRNVAAKWYRRAAKQGDIESMLGLATLYRHGRGVERDRESAMTWYRRAAETGDSRGRTELEAMAGEPQEVEPQAAEPAPPPVEETVEAPVEEPAPPPVEETLQTAVTESPTAAPAAYGVQLAAYRSRDGAVAAWRTLRAAHGDLLGTTAPRFIKTPRANGDPVYRLVVGSFESKAEAGALCARFKQRGVDCFVPRPYTNLR